MQNINLWVAFSFYDLTRYIKNMYICDSANILIA